LSRRCAITGTTGYLGSRLRDHMVASGWRVIGLNRRAVAGPPDDLVASFTLGGDAPPEALRDLEVLIHAAYDFEPRTAAEIRRVNVEGSIRLFREAVTAGVRRLVFISTLSAFPGCRSLYGQAKLRVEEECLALKGVVVRPGLIFGSRSGGMIGNLQRTVTRTRFVPVIGRGRQRLFLSHEDDLCRLIRVLVEDGRDYPQPIVAASPDPVTFREVLFHLASTSGRNVIGVPVPPSLMRLGLRLLEMLNLKPAFRSDSVVSLQDLNPSPDFSMLTRSGVTFRPFAPSGGGY
jgi:nucleoside-diphosphate-sugar epimerase